MQLEMNHVLFATDLGPRGPEIFRYAASLAMRYDAALHVLHVLEKPRAMRHSAYRHFISDELVEDWREDVHDEVAETIRGRLEKFCLSSLTPPERERVRIETIRALDGHPARVILAEARRIPVDCIVVGSNRYSALGEIVVGSVAHALTLRSDIPVLLVPLR